MSWSWSHTLEAYANARAQLEALDDSALAVIAAEWSASTFTDTVVNAGFELHLNRYDKAHKRFRKQLRPSARDRNRPVILEAVWLQIEALATCTNGGWEAWACPYGCGCHLLSFDSPDTD